MSFKLVAASLSVECNFEQPAATPFRIVAASLSVMPTIPVQAMASMSVECNYEASAAPFRLVAASLSVITSMQMATVASLSLLANEGSLQVIDIRKGTSILKKY